MALGVSSYAYLWRAEHLTLGQMLEDAARLGCTVFQACDLPWLEAAGRRELARMRASADGLGLSLETGTKGVRPEHLLKHLEIAGRLDASLVRSMLSDPHELPSLAEAVGWLRAVVPEFERAGVRLGLETYEQFSIVELCQVIEAVGSDHLGIVLDPGNSVARLEHPMEVATKAAPYVVGYHVKDFAFTRAEGTLGFTFAGAPLGRGLLDYNATCDVLDGYERSVNHVIEHWLTWRTSTQLTRETEAEWVADSVTYLKQKGRYGADAPRPERSRASRRELHRSEEKT